MDRHELEGTIPMEKTLILLKPDAFQRGLLGQIITRLENKGLQCVGAKMVLMTEAMINEHYAHITQIPSFPDIKKFMSSGPIMAMCWQGLDVIETVRKLCGQTKAREALPGTIRGDFGMSIQANLIHASDSPDSARTEINRFFSADEIFSYTQNNLDVIYAADEQELL